ncbi:MAG: hypothetical protein JXA82_06520 [Sedimentisphaerales bacterium]|nr:hypothetical protein [Sedimentisphaerales bacterium]
MNRWFVNPLCWMVTGPMSLLLVSGCNQGNMENALWGRVDDMGKQRNDLEYRITELEKENQDLQARVESLSAISPDKRVDVFAGLKEVELVDRTGFYDKDEDDVLESLIVYLKPIDTTGDVVKLPGKVEVQLWDLNADTGGALLGEWTVEPADLKNQWSGTFMTYYYRLTFPVADRIKDRSKELTVKVVFTDYVTGRTFRMQQAISQ